MADGLLGPGGVLDPATPTEGLGLLTDVEVPGPFKRGVKAGVSDLKSIAGGLVQMAGRGIGAKKLEAVGAGITTAAQEESAGARMQVEDVGRAFDAGIVPGLGAAADFVKYTVGNQVPMMATILAGGLAGRAAGAAFSRGATAAAREAAANIGTEAGIGAGAVALEAGQIFPEAVQTGVENPMTRTAAGALAAGALDTILPVIALRRLGLTAAKGAIAARAPGYGAIAKEAGATALGAGALESTTETAQSAIERLAAGQPLTGDAATSDYLNSGVMGAVMGVLTGGLVGAGRATGRPVQSTVAAPPAGAPEPAPSGNPPIIPETPPAILTPEEQELATLDALTAQHTVATQQVSAFEGQLAQTQEQHDVAVAQRDTLVAELALPLGERRTKAAILSEKKALQTQIEAAKRGIESIGGQLHAARSQVAELAPQVEAAAGVVKTRQILAQTPEGLNPAIVPKEGTIVPNLRTNVADSATIETQPPTDAEQVDKAVRGVHALFRENDMPLTTTQESLATPPKTPREVALAVEAGRQPRERVGAVDTKMVVGEREARGVAAAKEAIAATVGAKTEASLRGYTPAKRAALTRKLTDAVNSVVQEAAALPSLEEREAFAKAGIKKALSGKMEATTAGEVADSVVKTLYSKGASDQTQTPERLNVNDLMRLSADGDSAASNVLGMIDAKEITGADAAHNARLYNGARQDESVTNPNILRSHAALTQTEFEALPPIAQNAALDAYNAVMTSKGTQLRERLKALIGEDPNLTVQTFSAVPGEAIGRYTRVGPLKAIVSLALNAKEGLGVADHEGFHYIEDKKLDARERAVVRMAFEPGKPLFEKLLEKVRAYDLANQTNLADEIQAVPAEARAYGFEFWRRGELQAEGALARTFEKIKQFLEAVANLVRGLGFQSTEDIFTALDRGQFAERQVLANEGVGGVELSSRASDQTKSEAFKRWFGDSKVVDAEGEPLVVYHGTNETTYTPRVTRAGSGSARAELQRMAEKHSIKEWNDVPAVLERWVDTGMADRFGVTKQVAEHARELQRQAGLTEESPSSVGLGFSIFNMPSDGKELGAHFGTKQQATSFGKPFAMYLSLQNPLRMPDLGTWDYRSVMREARKRGVPISETEYDTVFNAGDSNAALREILLSKGYDGVVYKNEAEGKGDSYIAFRPEQIKSAIGNTGAFDPNNPDIRFSQAEAERWYRSALTDQVSALSMKSAPAQGWKDTLKGLVGKGLVKQAEIDAVGLGDWLDLQQGKITKEQVVQFVQENGVRVEEVMLGGANDLAQQRLEQAEAAVVEQALREHFTARGANDYALDAARGGLSEEQGANMSAEMRPLVDELSRAYAARTVDGADAQTNFSDPGLQLPGAKEGSYRELLLTLPQTESKRVSDLRAEIEDLVSMPSRVTTYKGENRTVAFDRLYAEFIAAGGTPTKPEGFRSSHFDQPNILAHVRFNERVAGTADIADIERRLVEAVGAKAPGDLGSGAPGVAIRKGFITEAEAADWSRARGMLSGYENAPGTGKRVLFIEEFQSDWAQKGKKEGFGVKQVWRVRSQQRGIINNTYDTKAEAEEVATDLARINNIPHGVVADTISIGIPSAPFVTKTDSWTALVLKRMIRYAAENGFDSIAWTTGAQQVERYSSALRKAVDVIEWAKTPEGVQIVGYKYATSLRAARATDPALLIEIDAHRGRLIAEHGDPRDMPASARRTYDNLGEQRRRIAGDLEKNKVVDTNYAENEVSDAIGKAMADRIRNDPNQTGTLEGENITVSDTGMAGYYDRIVPKVANAILKKLGGGRVGEVRFPLDEPAAHPSATKLVEEQTARSLQQGFTITPEVAIRAARGLDLFSKAAVDMSRLVAAGELEQEQLYGQFTSMVAGAKPPADLGRAAFGAAWEEMGGGVGRWWKKYISTPNFISHASAGFKNVFQTLNSYSRYRAVLVERMLKEEMPQWYDASSEDRTIAFNALLKRTVESISKTSPEFTALRGGLTESQRRLFDQATHMVEGFLTAELAVDDAMYKRNLTTPGEYEKAIADRRAQVADMIDKGYVPLQRYGDYTVHVYVDAVKPDGTPYKQTAGLQFFTHAAEAQWHAQMYIDELKRTGAGLKVEVGTHYKSSRDTTVSVQQFLDTARRNGIPLTQAERERIVKALSAADSQMRNRLLRRKNVPGFSTDGMRVLHEFGVRTAGKIAYAEFGHVIDAAASGQVVDSDVVHGRPEITVDDTRNLWVEEGPKSGFYRNRADELVDYVLVPDHTGGWSRTLRGAAMMYFIGGSLSAGLVNTMSVPMLVVPELAIHTEYTNALSTTLGAWKFAWQHQAILRDITRLKSDEALAIPGMTKELRDAMVAAADRLLDTEIHQIMGMAQGTLYSQSRTVQKAVEAWMSPFRVTEQLNRITSFIAAYKVATTGGVRQVDGSFKRLTDRELFKFAGGIVDSTQNNYNEANRPGAARHPIYALMFMFKSFPLFMTEAIVLMYKANPRAAVYMLLGLTAMTGVQGWPFAETIENLIDTIAQRLFNSPFNSRRAMRNMLKSASEALVGYDLSDIALRGLINQITGLNAASRIGAGDFVPGSRVGTADADQGRILEQILGAPYAMLKDSAENLGKFAGGAFTGDWKQTADALRAGGPTAVRNVIKGAEQLSDGYASDARGQRLVDVSTPAAIFQLIGLSSAGLAKGYELDAIDVQTKAFYTQVSADMTQQLVGALRDGDDEKVREIYEARDAWNAQYPEMPLLANGAAIRRQLMLSGMAMSERRLRLLPRQLRGGSVAAEGISGE